jgi:REP element-mobilizing transposase RayT
MVIAYHLVWTGYGWWLPNDPRGSMSHCTANEEIAQFGESHYGRRTIQPPSTTIRRFRDRASDVLKYPLLNFNDEQIQLIAEGFLLAIKESCYTSYACAIMPDHVHIFLRKHRDTAEDMIRNLQSQSRLRLSESDESDINHPIWTNGGWKGFLGSPAAIRRTIRYIEDNPPSSLTDHVKNGLSLENMTAGRFTTKRKNNFAACGLANRRRRWCAKLQASLKTDIRI